MIKGILFDLDDTLYEERQFFRSGFTVVARELEGRGYGKAEDLVAALESVVDRESRNGVFQKLAERTPFPAAWIPELVELFRAHKPAIRLAQDSVNVLPRLRKKFRLGCVTDGRAQIQNAKLEALGARAYLDAVVVTDELGPEYWKPHPRPFWTCCELLGIGPTEALFVGDSPERDMTGARNAGIAAIRIRRTGGYSERVEPADAAGVPRGEVRDLNELERLLETSRTWLERCEPGTHES